MTKRSHKKCCQFQTRTQTSELLWTVGFVWPSWSEHWPPGRTLDTAVSVTKLKTWRQWWRTSHSDLLCFSNGIYEGNVVTTEVNTPPQRCLAFSSWRSLSPFFFLSLAHLEAPSISIFLSGTNNNVLIILKKTNNLKNNFKIQDQSFEKLRW